MIDKIDPSDFDVADREFPSVHLPDLLQVRPDATVKALAGAIHDTLSDAFTLAVEAELDVDQPALVDGCVAQRLSLARMLFDALLERNGLKPLLRSVP